MNSEDTCSKESNMTNAQKLEAAEAKLAQAKNEIAEVRAAMKAEKTCKIKKGTWCLCWNDEFLAKKGPSIRRFDSFKDGKFRMVGDGGVKTFGWQHATPLNNYASVGMNSLLGKNLF